MTEQGWIPAGHLEAPKCRFRFWLWAECGGVRVRARGVGGLAAKGPVKQRTLFHCAGLLWGSSRHLGMQTDALEWGRRRCQDATQGPGGLTQLESAGVGTDHPPPALSPPQ